MAGIECGLPEIAGAVGLIGILLIIRIKFWTDGPRSKNSQAPTFGEAAQSYGNRRLGNHTPPPEIKKQGK